MKIWKAKKRTRCELTDGTDRTNLLENRALNDNDSISFIFSCEKSFRKTTSGSGSGLDEE